MPHAQMICVGIGYPLKAGDRLTYRLLINPNDVFRTCGLIAGAENLLRRIHCIFENERISIDSKHIELLIRQMLSRVAIESRGDTDFVVGELIDRRDFQKENNRVSQLVCITSSETPEFAIGQLVSLADFERHLLVLASENKTRATARSTIPAVAKPRLTSIFDFASPSVRKSFVDMLDRDSLARRALSTGGPFGELA